MPPVLRRDRAVVEIGKRLGRFDEATAGAALARVQATGLTAIDALVEAGALDDEGVKAVLAELPALTFRCAECGRDEIALPSEPATYPRRCEACRERAKKSGGATKTLGPASGTQKALGPGSGATRALGTASSAQKALGPGSGATRALGTASSAQKALGPGSGATKAPGPATGRIAPPPGPAPLKTTGRFPVGPPPAPPGVAPDSGLADHAGDPEGEEPRFKSHHSDPRATPRATPATASKDEDEPRFKSHHSDPRATPQATPAGTSGDGEEEPRFKSHHSDPRATPQATPSHASSDGDEPRFKSHHSDPRTAEEASAAPASAGGGDDLAFADVAGGPASTGAPDVARSSSQRLARQKLEELKGATVGDCVLEQVIGRGTMGSVFSAQHQKLGKRVAVKLLEPKLASDVKFVNRFFQEAQTLALLDNPHVVRVHAFDKDDAGRCYIVMEILEGGSVQGLLKKKGKLEIDDAVRIVSEAAKGLHAAHKVDLVHRDVKPANLMMTQDGKVKVVDFGLAVPTSGEVFLATEVVGTPVYMSPEQADGVRLDGRCDQYALGITLYQLVCGQPPFNQRKPVDVIAAHVKTPPPPPHTLREDMPAWLEDVILRMLAKAPDERFPSLAEVYQALDSRGANVKAASLEKLARPAVTIDARTIADLDVKTLSNAKIEMPGWALPIAVAVAVVAGSILFYTTTGAASVDERPGGPPHVLERRIAELRPRIERGSANDLAAALADLEGDLEAVGKGAGAANLAELKARGEQRLDELRTKKQTELRETVRGLLAKGRHAAAIEAATADAQLVASLHLEAFLADLRGEALGRLEADKGEEYVPSGLFRSGSEGEPSTTGAFYVDRTEVTNDAWAKLVESGKVPAPAAWKGATPPAGQGSRPVTGVSYEEADAFARAVGKRLPTSLEWEKAARGRDDTRAYPWGPTFVAGKANLLEGGSGSLEDVAARNGDVSPFGVLGLAGNALEWVAGPEGPLVAGGGFGSDALAGRVFARAPLDAKARDAAVGFRCVRDVE